jgi:hypothetical protein
MHALSNLQGLDAQFSTAAFAYFKVPSIDVLLIRRLTFLYVPDNAPSPNAWLTSSIKLDRPLPLTFCIQAPASPQHFAMQYEQRLQAAILHALTVEAHLAVQSDLINPRSGPVRMQQGLVHSVPFDPRSGPVRLRQGLVQSVPFNPRSGPVGSRPTVARASPVCSIQSPVGSPSDYKLGLVQSVPFDPRSGPVGSRPTAARSSPVCSIQSPVGSPSDCSKG